MITGNDYIHDYIHSCVLSDLCEFYSPPLSIQQQKMYTSKNKTTWRFTKHFWGSLTLFTKMLRFSSWAILQCARPRSENCDFSMVVFLFFFSALFLLELHIFFQFFSSLYFGSHHYFSFCCNSLQKQKITCIESGFLFNSYHHDSFLARFDSEWDLWIRPRLWSLYTPSNFPFL